MLYVEKRLIKLKFLVYTNNRVGKTPAEHEGTRVRMIMPDRRHAEFLSRNRFMFKNIAKDRIRCLLSMAEEKAHTDPTLSREYVAIAIRIGTRCRVRLPEHWKWRICRRCNTLLCPGLNCTVRIRRKRQPHVVTRCLCCGKILRKTIIRKSENDKAAVSIVAKPFGRFINQT